MKTMFAVILVMGMAGSLKAQSSIGVMIGVNSAEGQKIGEQVKAKVGSTSRYSVVEINSLDAELALDINCISVQNEDGTHIGYACDSVVNYFPDAVQPLSKSIPDAHALVVCGRDGQSCAESIFEIFVAGTQPEKLKKAATEMTETVALYNKIKQSSPQKVKAE